MVPPTPSHSTPFSSGNFSNPHISITITANNIQTPISRLKAQCSGLQPLLGTQTLTPPHMSSECPPQAHTFSWVPYVGNGSTVYESVGQMQVQSLPLPSSSSFIACQSWLCPSCSASFCPALFSIHAPSPAQTSCSLTWTMAPAFSPPPASSLTPLLFILCTGSEGLFPTQS